MKRAMKLPGGWEQLEFNLQRKQMDQGKRCDALKPKITLRRLESLDNLEQNFVSMLGVLFHARVAFTMLSAWMSKRDSGPFGGSDPKSPKLLCNIWERQIF